MSVKGTRRKRGVEMKSQEEVLSRFRNEFTTFETASHQYEKQEIDDKAYKAVYDV